MAQCVVFDERRLCVGQRPMPSATAPADHFLHSIHVDGPTPARQPTILSLRLRHLGDDDGIHVSKLRRQSSGSKSTWQAGMAA